MCSRSFTTRAMNAGTIALSCSIWRSSTHLRGLVTRPIHHPRVDQLRSVCRWFAALDRDPHGRAQAAERAVAERDVTAMRARDIAGDGEPEAGAAFVLVARVIKPQEWLEHFLAHAGRDAGTVVVDGHGQPAMIAMAGD